MKPTLPNLQGDDTSSNINSPFTIGLKDGGCPTGTVPIRRITKDDLIRQRFLSQIRGADESPYGDVSLLKKFLQLLFEFHNSNSFIIFFFRIWSSVFLMEPTQISLLKEDARFIYFYYSIFYPQKTNFSIF